MNEVEKTSFCATLCHFYYLVTEDIHQQNSEKAGV